MLTTGGMDLDLNEKRKLWIEHELGVSGKVDEKALRGSIIPDL